ncbi:Xylanase inhibitor, C-terminal [Dillenia turbinata]|uniref:Xylanase inhibitor, C-terminal n=1 Tax=Dillenia turbinata TaxID=194707 RepID=A0AAN8ZPL4_9MAGN
MNCNSRKCVILSVSCMIFILFISTSASASAALTLNLERNFPLLNHRAINFTELRLRDSRRHARILKGNTNGAINFQVAGSFDPEIAGLYFAKVKLGSAATEFSLQIDTGSSLTWVTCKSCDNCPKSTVLAIQLNSYDPTSSSTAALVPCSSHTCASLSQSGSNSCSVQGSQCTYRLEYEDGSRTLGYYVYDRFAFNTIFKNSLTGSSFASILFGCSTHQDGELTFAKAAVDGILAFGPQDLSIVSQLSSQGIAPKAFSHCFRGDGVGGGILVLGQILEPSIIYTPLDLSQSQYTLKMESIAVNGQSLPVDPAVFSTSTGQGTLVDTGTTLAYLVPEAYQPFLNAITAAVTGLATPVQSPDNFCYHVLVIASINVIFPRVSLKFSGGASLNLWPVDYLIHDYRVGGAMWCMGFQKAQDRFTILGGLHIMIDRDPFEKWEKITFEFMAAFY